MSLDQIGQKLKSARDVSGLSLAQIQEKTKIPYSHLASIDAGNFDDLPEPVYVSGFIRRYAECVGLDGQELVDEYRNEMDSSIEPPKKTGLLFKSQKNNGNHMSAQANYYNRQRAETSGPNLFKLIPFYALWIVLILVLIIYLVNRQGEIEQNQQDPGLLTLKQSVAIPKTAPTAISNGTVNQTNSATEQDDSATKDSYKVTIKAKNHVWVEVKAVSNGEALFNGFVEAGDKHDFSDKEGLRITAINGSIAVLASGKVNEFGAAGRSTEKLFSNNKASQVAESQSSDNTSDLTSAKPSTVKPSVAKSSTTSSTSVATQSSTANKKPEATSDTIITKKPAAATSASTTSAVITVAPKPHPAKENLPIHEAVTQNTESGSQNSKAIDVPYRYSE